MFCALGRELVSTALPGSLPSWEKHGASFLTTSGLQTLQAGRVQIQLRTEPGASPEPSGYPLPHPFHCLHSQGLCDIVQEAGIKAIPQKERQKGYMAV